MTDAIGIGFFQFDNLVRNRVPFCLFILSTKVDEICQIYKSQELEHLTRYGVICESGYSVESAQHVLEGRKYRQIDPVLVLCPNGVESKKLANILGTRGFTNCYFVEGGFAQLRESIHEPEFF